MNTFKFENETTGKSWLAKVVKKGDRYGLNNCLTHDKPASMVEFYDTSNGEQFVSRYYVETILSIKNYCGLMLDACQPTWHLDGKSIDAVKDWLKSI